MRFASPVVLGLMLAMGGMSLGAPAAAAAKEKAAQVPKLKLSKGFLDPIRKVNDAVNKKEVDAAKAALPAAKAAIESNDDKYQYYSLLLNLSIVAKDAAMQNEALMGMLETGLVPEGQQGQFNAIVANNELAAKNYDAALAYGQKAQAQGYKPEQVYPILAQAVWAKADAANLDPEAKKAEIAKGLTLFKQGIDAMKAAGQAVPAQWYQVGVSKAAAAKLPELTNWADMAFAADPSGANLRTVLRVFQRDNPAMTNREDLDLLRLMRISGGLALKPDYLEYAEMAFKGGLFGEVKSIIDEGRAKGVLNSTDGNDYYTVATKRIASDKASLPAADSDAAKSSSGKIAGATGDAYMGYGEYAKAVPLYQMALKKGSIDTGEVYTRLGISQALTGDTAAAKASLANVTDGIRGGIAKYWLKWIEAHPDQVNADAAVTADASAAAPAVAAAN